MSEVQQTAVFFVTVVLWGFLTSAVYRSISRSNERLVSRVLTTLWAMSILLWSVWVLIRAPSFVEVDRLLTGFWVIAVGVVLLALVALGAQRAFEVLKANGEAKTEKPVEDEKE